MRLARLSPKEWYRHSSRELQFYATDEEVADFILDVLGPAVMAIGNQKVRVGHEYADKAFAFRLSTVALTSAVEAARWKFWMLSASADKTWLAEPSTLDATCAVNGVIQLQHGGPVGSKRDASGIGLVSSVRNVSTGEIRRHVEATEQFKKLVARIRPALVYSSIYTLKDGAMADLKKWLADTERMWADQLASFKAHVERKRK